MRHLFSRHRFREVARRQLTLFAADNSTLVDDARAARAAYDDERDPAIALESYGDHDTNASLIEAELEQMCERYASTLEPKLARRYIATFAKEARRAYGDIIPGFAPHDGRLD